MSEGTQTTAAYRQDNSEYTALSIIQARLDTKPLLLDLYKNLSGKILVTEIDQQGRIIEKIKIVGKAKANDEGVSEIMSSFISIVNPGGLQGNITDERYDEFVYQNHVNFTVSIMANRVSWGISVSDCPGIINQYMNIVRLFATRPIDNKERDSYSRSLVSNEKSAVMDKKGVLNMFGGNS